MEKLRYNSEWKNGSPVITVARQKLQSIGKRAAWLSRIDTTFTVATAQQLIAGTRRYSDSRIKALNRKIIDAGYTISFEQSDFDRPDRTVIDRKETNVKLTIKKMETQKQQEATAMTITPLLAQDWMKRNFNRNRTVNKDIVLFYADQMRRGLWQLNGDTIKFDTEGKLLDGQHRLLACIKANTSFSSYVVFQIQPDAYLSQNGGYKAKMADYVKYNGVKNYKLASAILSGYLKLKNGRQTSQSNPIARIASADVVDLYYKNSDIVDEIATNVSTWKTRTKIIQGSVAGPFVMFCMLEKNYPLDFMISFFDNLYDFKYYENETIVNTRDFIRRIYENKDTTQKWLYTVDNTRRILVYAFTNYVQGVSLKKFNAFMVLLRNGTAKDVESIPYYVNIFEQQ